jgi:hypothetical protein
MQQASVSRVERLCEKAQPSVCVLGLAERAADARSASIIDIGGESTLVDVA